MTDVNVEDLENFISDVVETMTERHDESQKEMLENPKDLFNSGRALAYQEIYEIIESRLKTYGVKVDA
ncbi:MAG: hypothetical protein K6B74_10155 [Ruminococcus sp.]|nr:hypothetical protein [Ruminococcus sp.]